MTGRRHRPWPRVIVALLAAIVAAATISWTSASAVVITRADGAPAAGAYFRYHYSGSFINFVHPISYVAKGSVIARADANGRAAIPFRLHVRRPFPISTPPSVFVDCVYVPSLHNAFGPVGRSTSSVPGVFTIEEQRRQIVVFDLADNPEHWERSLRHIFHCIQSTVWQIGAIAPADPQDTRTAAHTREVIGHLRRDYAEFIARYADVPRPAPSARDSLTESERDHAAANLAREPLWGQFVERDWRRKLKQLDTLEATLK